MVQFLFSISLFLSASLLFMIQPMVAKTLLPAYGGTPAVWTICILFFQTLLLVAYGYAWLLSRFKGLWYWRLCHVAIIVAGLSFLPLHFVSAPGSDSPDLSILNNLLYQLGLPLLIVASSAPLLQFAYSKTQGKKAKDPYFLYVASNLGSLIALLSYPWLLERFAGINEQFYYWNYLFVAYLVMMAAILFIVPYKNTQTIKLPEQSIGFKIRFLWVFYSFIPCSLMMGVTFYISTDIAPTPLFWVIPLALYLLTYVITFAEKPLVSHAWITRNSLYFIIFPMLAFIMGTHLLSMAQLIIFNLSCFFILALLCHGELVKIRPPASQLTDFYLCLAFGGVLAGLFNGVLAPRLFNGSYEYPFMLALATLCIPMSVKKFKTDPAALQNKLKLHPGLNFIRMQFNLVPLIVVLLLVSNYYISDLPSLHWLKEFKVIEIVTLTIILVWPASNINLFVGLFLLLIFIFNSTFPAMHVLTQQRNFYGVKQVLAKTGVHALISQNTMHGYQSVGNEHSTKGDIAYYGPILPLIKTLQQNHPLHAGVLGLGTGSMACQFQREDKLEMIDIDEQVIAIAKDPQLFTYLRDCPPAISIIEGDGRQVLQRRKAGTLDLLVVDAFLSDAIPAHLLTLEAMQLYQKILTPDGVIAINASNRHINILPVMAAVGVQLDLIVLQKEDTGSAKNGQFASEWILLTANQPVAMAMMSQGWHFVTNQKKHLWTDDYSNIVSLLK